MCDTGQGNLEDCENHIRGSTENSVSTFSQSIIATITIIIMIVKEDCILSPVA